MALLSNIGREVRGTGRTHLSCHERGRLLLVPVAEVLYFKADLKYVTARTVDREYLLDEAIFLREGRMVDSLSRPEGLRAAYRRAMTGPSRS